MFNAENGNFGIQRNTTTFGPRYHSVLRHPAQEPPLPSLVLSRETQDTPSDLQHCMQNFFESINKKCTIEMG